MKHIYRDFQEMYATIRGKIIEVKPTERKKPVHKKNVKEEPKEELKEEVKEEVKEEPKPKKTSKKKKEE